MTTELHWPAIGLRLVLTLAAGTILGTERSKTGHPAGLRTTLLVTLAASVSMIQMNLLIPTNGKPPDSYVVMDLMRLPLGILTGVGFIGAGAIIRKGEMVLGITTAATMWFATVVGLCLGGGQLILGMTATAIGFVILWALRFGERHLETYQRGSLVVVSHGVNTTAQSLSSLIRSHEIQIKSTSALYWAAEERSEFRFEVRWHRKDPAAVPDIVDHLRARPGVSSCKWSSRGQATGW